MLDRAAIAHLERQVGESHLYVRPADLAAYAYDAFGASGEQRLPDAVAFPATTEEVSRVIQVCTDRGLPVVPRGAGTGYVAGAVAAHGGVILNLCRMRRVLGIEKEAGRLHVQAGVVTATAHAAAAAVGLYYPPDPGSSTTSTIGGNIATNAAGPHTLRYGTTADYVAGATVVTADGHVHRLGEGGSKTDLLSLLPGSEGTLAVVTDAVLRLLPAPASRSTLLATFADMRTAANAVAAISAAGILPAAIEYLDSAALRAVAETGIMAVPQAGAVVIVEVEGSESAVRTDAEAVATAFARAGATTTRTAENAVDAGAMWAMRKAVSAAVAKVMIGKVNEDVVVPRDRIPELLDRCNAIGDTHQVPVVTFGHLGDGNLHISFLIDPRVVGERARADAASAELFEAVLGMNGSLSGEHGVGTTKLAFVERQLGAGTVELMRRIKSHYDPFGTLNPGVKIPAAAAGEPAANPVAAATRTG